MTDIKSIQERLNEKADKALKKKLENAKQEFMRQIKPCTSDYISVTGEENEKCKSVYAILTLICTYVFDKRREAWRGIESQNFISKLDSVSEDVAQLRDEIDF